MLFTLQTFPWHRSLGAAVVLTAMIGLFFSPLITLPTWLALAILILGSWLINWLMFPDMTGDDDDLVAMGIWLLISFVVIVVTALWINWQVANDQLWRDTLLTSLTICIAFATIANIVNRFGAVVFLVAVIFLVVGSVLASLIIYWLLAAFRIPEVSKLALLTIGIILLAFTAGRIENRQQRSQPTS